MTDIASSNVSVDLANAKIYQLYDPINHAAEHMRVVHADVTITTSSNKDYPNDGIDLSTLFTAGHDNDLGIDENNVWEFSIENGLLYDGASAAAADAYACSFDRANKKLIVRTSKEDGSDATAGLHEGAVSGLASGNSMTFRIKVVGRKRGV